ncbi:MAG: T9SS type A sorting domain-containing protein [Paludibacter sp.]|nr:T9SS type A sorting domain-containing protein [Paludibacter sp.]
MIDLTSTVVPDASYLQTSVRTWTDSTFVANVPGTVDHWEYSTKSDTVRYNSKWTYYYQATPTFSVKEMVNGDTVSYFGDKNYIVTDNLTNTNDTLDLYNETDRSYLFGQPLFRQGTIYDFLLSAYEKYTNYVSDPAVTVQYPVTSGSVNMSNDIDLNQNLSPIPMDSTGRAVYEFMAGPPNLTTGTNNFFATLNLGAVSYYWDMGTAPITAWHLGDRTTGTDFMTAGPDQITTVLRDPPGNSSSSFIEQGTTISSTSGLSLGVGANTETNLTASLGPKIISWVGLGAGVTTEEETTLDVSAGLKTEFKYTNATESSQTTTFTERFETSSDPAYVGAGGDVFIGNSTNILYGLTNGISIQKNYVNEFEDESSGNAFTTQGDYSIAPSVSLAYGQTFDTRFAFTQSDIEQIMIPKWQLGLAALLKPFGTPQPNTASITSPVYVSNLPQSNANFGKLNTDPVFGADASTPEHFDSGPSYKIYFPDGYDMTKFTVDSVMYFNNQINGWINVLAQNEQEKVEMTKLGNYSFGSGASIQYSKTSSASTSSTDTYHIMISPTIGLKTGGDIMGIGLELEVKAEIVGESDITTGTSSETSISSGFTLQGSNEQITVDYGMTPSGTFAFKTRGGRTACPYEGGNVTKYYQPGTALDEATMQIEVPKISVSSTPQVINVPSNRAATYTLALQNESETGDNIWYQLAVDENTNPNGAILKIDGGVIGDGKLFLVTAGSTLQKTLTLEKGTADTYNNIGLILRSQCEGDVIADTAYVSASFVPACSDVAITSPSNNWILNADSQTGDTLNITIANYDVNFPNFGYIKLEYRPTSSPTWNTITTFYPSALYPNAQGTKEDIGTRAEIVYPWKTPSADGAYELRATTASVNIVGNAIVGDPLSTYTTDAVTGYKDMQRPVSLGAPSPAGGILGTGDELSITFNKDIQTGMLTQNNFSITGVLNAQPIAEPNVGLAFAGTQAAKTELPIFTNGSFSIETWFKRDVNSAGTLFAYGSNNNPVSLGFDATGRAVVTIGSESYTSVNAVANDDTWKYIAMAYDRSSNAVSVYEFEGAITNTLFTNKSFTASPETQGMLVVGNNMAENNGFSGDVAQLNFYGVNRTQADASAGKSVSKTGNEYGLIGYWALDEGTGTFALDKARSRNLLLNNSDWYIYPSGYAKQTSNNYFSIPVSTYPLDIFSDLTLEFWFRSAGNSQPNQTIFSADNGSIGVNANGGLTLYQADGTENQVLTNANLIDAKWHHIAMSVRRNGNVNVYIDGVTAATFAESMLGTMGSGYYYFGAKHTQPNTFGQYFAGYFDEIRLWNSALTSDGILLNQNSKLNGNEAGLEAYYPFETYTKQSNGLITVTPTNANFATGDNNTAAGTATDFSTTAMSVKDVRPVENVPFTYVASSNKIVFTLDPAYFARVEGTALTLSVSDVYDMHNNKSNTESWTAFVNRNALRWDADPVNITMQAGDLVTFTARMTNTGGTTLSYSIDNLPTWLTVSSSIGNLQPLANKDLTFTVNQGINIGNYETAVGLSSGNGVTEILPVQVKVTGQLPDWTVNPNAFESSMNITGQIQIAGVFQEDTYDRLGAFINDVCVGITSPKYVDAYNAYFTFADIYGNSGDINQPLTFKLWDASTGHIYPQLETSIGEIHFAPSTILGSPANPVIFNALNLVGQDIPLKNGWNWISANVLNDNPSILNQMKSSLANTGELIKGHAAYIQQPNWMGMLDNISEKEMYSVKVNSDCTLSLLGQYADPATTLIPIVQGWNWIGYIPSFSLPVQSALAGMNAQTGDMIKGQTNYATYMGASGWIGSLTYMQQGKGYMYYSNNATSQSFIYPSTNPMQNVIELVPAANEPADMNWTVNPNNFSNNMTMTAMVVNDNQEVRSDMIEIAAFSGNDCRGSVMLQYEESLDKYIGYLMIYGNGNESITLKVYDHATGNEYDANNSAMQFAADAIYGTPSNPYVIGIGATGIDNVTLSQISVFPNPVQKDLYINYPWKSIDIIEIIDMTGQVVYHQDNFEGKSIKVSDLTSGMYMLKIVNNKNSIVEKFIKE